MLDRRPVVLGWTLVVAVCLGTIALAQEKGTDPRPLRVGVVDMSVALKRYVRKDELDKELEGRRTKLESDLKVLEVLAEDLRKQLDGMRTMADSPAYRDKWTELKSLLAKYESQRANGLQELQIRIEGNTLKLLAEIDDVVAPYSVANGYDLILRVETARASSLVPGDLKDLSEGEFQRRVFQGNVRDVLYCHAKLDVTEAVVRALNSDENLKKRRAR